MDCFNRESLVARLQDAQMETGGVALSSSSSSLLKLVVPQIRMLPTAMMMNHTLLQELRQKMIRELKQE
jgi:hypothetical protein